jgi:hypothetical protein
VHASCACKPWWWWWWWWSGQQLEFHPYTHNNDDALRESCWW